MADLSKMFAKKAPADANHNPPVAQDVSPTPEVAPDVAVEAAPETPTQDEAAAPPARKGLGFLGKVAPRSDAGSGSGTPVSTPTPAAAKAPTKLAGLSLGKAAPKESVDLPTAAEVAKAGDDLDLAALLNDESEAPARVARPLPADHVPATAPIRPVPDDATAPMLQFVKLIDSVYEMQFDQDLLGNVIKSIMVELQTNPAYISADWKKSLVQPDDIRVWIRNMREVMGLNKIVKAEKKAKRASSKSKKVDLNEMLDDLASLGFTMET